MRGLLAALLLAPALALPQDLYQQHCASCHGEKRLGGMGPALLPESLSRLKKPQAARMIRDSRPGVQMPAFKAQLKDEEIASVLTFVRNSFGNQAEPIQAQQVQKVRIAQPGRATNTHPAQREPQHDERRNGEPPQRAGREAQGERGTGHARRAVAGEVRSAQRTPAPGAAPGTHRPPARSRAHRP